MTVRSEVVVVFPCVPATPTERWAAVMAASITDRWTVGMPIERDSTSSMFVCGIAVEYTTMSDPCTSDASWPMCTSTPDAPSVRTVSEEFRSLPLTEWPIRARMIATALMPGPQTPTTWQRIGRARSMRGAGLSTGRVMGSPLFHPGITPGRRSR
ncbi:MAG: hypothetical protein EBS32_01365 [Actinobacteria bacterium]|nr:hypothetical protein [Actinomycetota bacterium]